MYGRSGYSKEINYPDLDDTLSPHAYSPKEGLQEDDLKKKELDELFPIEQDEEVS